MRTNARRLPSLRPVALSAAAVALAMSASAQTGGKPSAVPEMPPLAESVNVSITNVEVMVTDRKGNRVHGLTRDDFEVFEDGIPQRITNFYAVEGGRAILAGGQQISISGEAKANPEPAEIPPELRAKYVFYIDNLNIDPLHRNRVFRSLKDFVGKTIGPNAEGMVVTANRSLKVRQKFTSQSGPILDVLDDIERETGGQTSTVAQRKDALQQINDAQSESQALGIAQQTARSMDDDLHYTVDDLKTTLDSLAGVQGRKILVYLSDGLPETVGQELFDAIQKKFQSSSAPMEAFEFDRTASYASIIRDATAQGVSIYTIDTAGLQITEGVSAEYGQTDARPSSFLMQQNLQAPLVTMAEETGGIAAINTNDPKEQLSEIEKDFSDFYSLGYRSPRSAADKVHRIEVRLKNGKGLKLRYRSSYTEKSIETQTAEAVTAALYYGRSDNPLNVTIAAGDPKPYSGANYLVPVKVSIPIGNVTLAPEGNDYHGRVYLYFIVLDSEGNRSDLQVRPLDIKVSGKKYDSARHKDFAYDAQLMMIPGGQKLSVAVRDALSGAVSYVQKSIFVSVLPEGPSKKTN